MKLFNQPPAKKISFPNSPITVSELLVKFRFGPDDTSIN